MNPEKSTPAPNPDQPQRSTGQPKGTPAPPSSKERELEVEKIELERAMREASRPIPGTLGGDLKP